MQIFLSVIFCIVIGMPSQGFATPAINDQPESSVTFSSGDRHLKITSLGPDLIRVQKYDSHLNGDLSIIAWGALEKDVPLLETKYSADVAEISVENSVLSIQIDLDTLNITFSNGENLLLQEIGEKPCLYCQAFNTQNDVHFAGLGHGSRGSVRDGDITSRLPSLDLAGTQAGTNYGRSSENVGGKFQSPLIVPFYLTDAGYGILLNTSYPTTFSFGHDNHYHFGAPESPHDGIDYVFISGEKPADVLNSYTLLTGRPRLPQRSIFGLQLSDKAHDHESETPSNEWWWRQKITAHRAAGFPLDHIVNDNRWRAGGGERCLSRFAWDENRYPNPSEYKAWLDENGLTATLDFNRCIATQTPGWQNSFNIKGDFSAVEYGDAMPDLTNPSFRRWWWQTLFNNTYDPNLNYPATGIWIDEFDEYYSLDPETKLFDGSTWLETANLWFLLIAEALVRDGWDEDIGEQLRPFVWIRGGTAGMQRYATLWSGDIDSSRFEMRDTVKSMQAAGLSGFAFWGHDAGGFADHEKMRNDSSEYPDTDIYRDWSIALGAFSPIWKPHGKGLSRWPMDHSNEDQAIFLKYAKERYQLMPYIYSLAKEAAESGIPMARAMFLEYPDAPEAWASDEQYLWGNAMLVVPDFDADGNVTPWFPPGKWYDYWTDIPVADPHTAQPATDRLPVYVKAGSVIPMADYALSTTFIDSSRITVHVWPGSDGLFVLREDDNTSERYLTREEQMETRLTWNDATYTLQVTPDDGIWQGQPKTRTYDVVLHTPGGLLSRRGKTLPIHEAFSITMESE